MKNTRIELNPTQTVLVIGGNGFIGKSIVDQLENVGAHVIVGTRNNTDKTLSETRKIRLHELHNQEQCEKLLKGVDVVVNAVGILRQRAGESYDQVHHLAVEYLANACADKNIRFVHISALGLYNLTKSRFLSSKRLGEIAIKKSKADWFICRPSLVDGNDGYGAKWFRRVAGWPIHICPANAVAKLAPIHVKDLGEAIAKIALMTKAPNNASERIYELGGDQCVNVTDYLSLLNKGRAQLRLTVPAWLARMTSHLLDLLHLTPYSFGHYELLKFDNIPKTQQAKMLLGRNFRRLGEKQKAKELFGAGVIEAKNQHG